MNPSSRVRARKIAPDLFVGLGGLLTSLLTVAGLWWIQAEFSYALYSWTLAFVIPIGAMLAGFAGAIGYYGGARLLGVRPSLLLLVNILLTAVGAFFTLHFLLYVTLETQGKLIRDYLSFGRYLDQTIRSTSLVIHYHAKTIGTTGDLGAWGYGLAVLQILGFAVGGFAVFGLLVALPYCERCARYFSSKGIQIRYTNDPRAVQAFSVELGRDFAAGVLAPAVAKHRAMGNLKRQKGDFLRAVIQIHYCKRCGRHRVRYTVETGGDKGWKEIPQLTVIGVSDQEVAG